MTIEEVTKRMFEIQTRKKALEILSNDMEKVLLTHMKNEDLVEKRIGDDHNVRVTVSKRRGVDTQRVHDLVGDVMTSRYGNITMGNFDALMKDPDLPEDIKPLVKDLVHYNYGDPKIKIEQVNEDPFA